LNFNKSIAHANKIPTKRRSPNVCYVFPEVQGVIIQELTTQVKEYKGKSKKKRQKANKKEI